MNALEICARLIELEQRDRLVDRLSVVARFSAARLAPWWAWTAWLAVGLTVGRIQHGTRGRA